MINRKNNLLDFYGSKNELVSSKIAGSAVEKRISFKQLYLLPRDERKP